MDKTTSPFSPTPGNPFPGISKPVSQAGSSKPDAVDAEAEGAWTDPDRKFSKKIESLATTPKQRGAFFTEDASSKDLALVTAKYKDIKVYWLVDPTSDLVYDAKFFSYGGPVSIALGEKLCSLVKGMKMDSATAITIPRMADLLADEPGRPATAAPAEEAFASLPPLLANAKEVYASAKALALATLAMKAAQVGGKGSKTSFDSLTAADEAWLKQPKDQQIKAIEEILDRDIRPGLNSDGGDMQIEDLEEGYRLLIKYQGACGSCGSSTGATLAYIEDSLRRQIFGGMQVVPVNV
ncbi:MAG TPA: NifU family protein [Fibrobacteria bacterium]|nr:NifU family protein [Fibrobacteria bacterium]